MQVYGTGMAHRNRFSSFDNLNACAEALYAAALGERHSAQAPGITLDTFADWAGQIAAAPAPATLKFWLTSHIPLTVEIAPRGADPVWDQVTINGQVCGNRCGGRQVFTVLAAPYLVQRFGPPAGPLGAATTVAYRDAAAALLQGLAAQAGQKG